MSARIANPSRALTVHMIAEVGGLDLAMAVEFGDGVLVTGVFAVIGWHSHILHMPDTLHQPTVELGLAYK